ncbi:hypothetical protein [Bacillus toyonensis]|nr:hypothetical protein [Bacillus toyonensis]
MGCLISQDQLFWCITTLVIVFIGGFQIGSLIGLKQKNKKNV